jgi:hypothetical protein
MENPAVHCEQVEVPTLEDNPEEHVKHIVAFILGLYLPEEHS